MSLYRLLLSWSITTLGLPKPEPSTNEDNNGQCVGGLITSKESVPSNTGLHRLSHEDPAGDAQSEYVFDASAGQDTCAYSIDTGVRPDHEEFTNRVEALWDCTTAASSGDKDNESKNFGCSEVDKNNEEVKKNWDGNGHGTHTAATILGTKYGVAKKARLIAIKVLSADGSGDPLNAVSALRLAASDAKKRQARGECKRGTAANLSLGTQLLGTLLTEAQGSSMRDAVNKAADDGLFCSVAAGNADSSAWTASPANSIKACVVGALDESNKKACFSNFGSNVDVWAPGQNILSAWKDGKDSTLAISGTSMAAPHIAGLKLYLDSLCTGEPRKLGEKNPEDACAYIKKSGFDFTYMTFGLNQGISGLGAPINVPLPTCGLLDIFPISVFAPQFDEKRAFNGGECACRGWS